MTITPETAQVIEDAIEARLIDVHVALPGAVQKYVPTKQTADIELQLDRILPKADGTFVTESLPILQNIRVAFPGGGDFYVSFPLKVGDTGLVIFNEMSIDQWRSIGVVTSPGDIGRHTLTGGVFYPGLTTDLDAITDADIATKAVFGRRGGAAVTIANDDETEVKNAAGSFKLTAAGQFDANGNFTVDP